LQILQSKHLTHSINEIDGFSVVGSKPSHASCGVWQTFGCLRHKQAYVRQFKKSCFRPSCKVCYTSWAYRQSKRTLQKLNSMRKNNTLKHSILILSKTWTIQSKKELIQKLKDSGVESACLIFTPFDESNNGKFFLKNTVHIFYTGIIKGSHYPQNDLDGTNKTLFQTLQVTFLNAGIKKGLHFISWIGKTQYCTLLNESSKSNGKNCPICNKKLKLIYYSGDKEPIPPDEWYDGETDKENWEYCVSNYESIWKKIIRKIKKCSERINLFTTL